MSKLPIPYAFIAAEAGRSRNRTHSDMRQFWRGAFSHLIEQGCRTVGVISGFSTATVGGLSKSNRRAWTLFREEMAISGLETKEDWLTGPDNEDAELTRFGYHAFHQLWRQPKKPEALIVYPDVVARGVILRALEAKVRIPRQLKCVFHRNKHLEMFCPFPATWGIFDEEQVAEDLIRIVQRQLEGKPVEMVKIPFTFSKSDGI